MKEFKNTEIARENIKYTYKDELVKRMMSAFPHSNTFFIRRCADAILEKIRVNPASIIDGKIDLSINWNSLYYRENVNKKIKSGSNVYYATGMTLSNGEWKECYWKIKADSLSEAAKIAESDKAFYLHSIKDDYTWQNADYCNNKTNKK